MCLHSIGFSYLRESRAPAETVAGQMPFGVSTKPGQCEAICGEDCSAGHIQSEDAILDGRSDRGLHGTADRVRRSVSGNRPEEED